MSERLTTPMLERLTRKIDVGEVVTAMIKRRGQMKVALGDSYEATVGEIRGLLSLRARTSGLSELEAAIDWSKEVADDKVAVGIVIAAYIENMEERARPSDSGDAKG